jgi:hypothetical protein
MAGLTGALAVGLTLAATAGAATFTPNTFEDNNFTTNTVDTGDCLAGSTDPCSLREAVEAANEAASDDEVVLSEGRYELDPDFGELFVQANTPNQDPAGTLLVRGVGARLSTIDANGGDNDANRVMSFNARTVSELRDLGVTGGFIGDDQGGALDIRDSESDSDDAVVTLLRTWIYDNHDEDDDGGAIKNNGKLTIRESLLSGNTAGRDGGAIENDDELTIVNSTLTGNEAGTFDDSADGGAIDNDGEQSEFPRIFRGSLLTEVPAKAPFLRVENSTIAGNSAPNGVGGGVATEEETNCEVASIAGNCEGPAAYALFHNSIVSGNTANADANCSNNFPADDPEFASSQGYNLENGATCLFTATGDKDAAAGTGALANNGGPTDTLRLEDGSVAIDGGDPANCQPIDQRGVTRPQRTTCDIGAFEREPVPPLAPVVQPETPRGEQCTDPVPPITTLRNAGLTVRSNRVTLVGTSRDPDPCASGVQRVEVSMARVSGTDLNCRFIRSTTRFVITPFRNCRRPVLFSARGTTDWSFTFRVRLTPGKYRAQARGYDNVRNKETPKKRRNIVYFEVK